MFFWRIPGQTTLLTGRFWHSWRLHIRPIVVTILDFISVLNREIPRMNWMIVTYIFCRNDNNNLRLFDKRVLKALLVRDARSVEDVGEITYEGRKLLLDVACEPFSLLFLLLFC